ncbi:MAG: hydroxyethylthiazole kinase [Roseibium sp.]|nr:hydroxyethylthiazole kinase [Roseibium sp.]
MNAPSPALTPAMVGRVLDQIRARAPRVHALTNTVAQTLTANVLLALGAVPSMTVAADEVRAFTATADALLVNLGTLDDERRRSMPLAIEAAQSCKRPFVLDPVFVDRSPERAAFAQALIGLSPTVLRVNPDELTALSPKAIGPAEMAETGPVVAVTGATDRVFGPGRLTAALANGHPLLSKTTATGCAGGAVIAASVAVSNNVFSGVCAGLSIFNIAGEIAAERARGPGSLVPELLDALYGLCAADIAARLKTEPA